MTHDAPEYRPPNPQHVDTTRHNDIRYWAKEFKCTPDQIRAAVKAAGHSSAAVKAYLASR